MKILFVSHGHPTFSAGGGEIAAYELFKGFRMAGHDAHFLARVGASHMTQHSGTPFHAIGDSGVEYLYYSEGFDYYFHSGLKSNIRQPLRALLQGIQPDVIHFQHTVHIGLEWLQIFREFLPHVPLIYTLHEYLPICANHGQMLRTYDNRVCEGASPSACARCFPNRSSAEFRMRELFIKGHLRHVDAFIAPSHFLLGKYVEWGVAAEKMRFIENGRILQPEAPAPDEGSLERAGDLRGRFGFFGQLNVFKGVLVLLDAARLLEDSGAAENIRIYLYGANLNYQTPEFQERFASAVKACGRRVKVFPEYKPDDLPQLMRNVDWVVVPSIWYENSPLVIQEAYMHRRPVICSDIGGMAEKVLNGRTGLHFRAGSSEDLADTMIRAATSPGLWESLRQQLPHVFSVQQSVDDHLQLYRELVQYRKSLTVTA